MSNELYLNDSQLNDPIQDIKDGINDPTQIEEQTPPGFFQTLRNPLELMFEESLPASLYQYITGNTKKVQAEEALNFLQNNPNLQGTGQYNEALRIYKKFGYLLEQGEQSFDAKEIINMAKKYPSVVGAELINMLIADPYLLLLPSTVFSRLGRGVVNASRLKLANKYKRLPKRVKGKIMQEAKRDIKVGAMASTLLPFAFSTGLQLGEKGEIDASRTTAETTFGATAGLLISTALGGISALGSKATFVAQPKINQAITNRLNKYQSLDDAIKITKTGNIKLIDDIIDTDLKNSLKNFKPEKIDAIKAQISVGIRDVLENGRDSIKSSLVKAATFGTIGATAQFLTEEKDKVEESIKGFAAGAGFYAGYRVLGKLFGQARKLDLLPDPSDRIKVFHNINKTKVNNNLEYNKYGKAIPDSELTKDQLEAKRIIQKYFDTMYKTLTNELDDFNFQINYRSNYAPLVFQDFITGSTKEFGERIFGSSTKSSRFFRERIFDDINQALEAGKKLKPGMDDPAKLIQVYTFSASKALANRNIVHYLKNYRTRLLDRVSHAEQKNRVSGLWTRRVI